MIRIKDIAKEAGVSPTTVSNVIHGNTKKVSKANIDKIQKILEKNQYIPSMSALMLAENRSRLIGELLYAFSSGQFAGRKLEAGRHLEGGGVDHPGSVLRGEPGTE